MADGGDPQRNLNASANFAKRTILRTSERVKHNRHPLSSLFADRLLCITSQTNCPLSDTVLKRHCTKVISSGSDPLNALFTWDTKSAPRMPDLRSSSTEVLFIGFEPLPSNAPSVTDGRKFILLNLLKK
jgi:hypothetical protein